MRLLAQVTQDVPINDTVFFVTLTQGYRGALIRANTLGAATRLIINDTGDTYTQRIASLLTGAEDQNNGHFIFTPITGQLLVLTTVGPAAIRVNISFYDEPPPNVAGFFLADFRVNAIAALATFTSETLAVGRFPNISLLASADRAGEFHIDQSVDGATFINDALQSGTFGATGGIVSGSNVMNGPDFRYRVVNTDAANVNNVTTALWLSA